MNVNKAKEILKDEINRSNKILDCATSQKLEILNFLFMFFILV
jgi:hypothetical protein